MTDTVPLPEPYYPQWSHSNEQHAWVASQVHAHAAAVSAADNAALRAECDGLRADAARYLYLRDVAWDAGSLIFYAERYGPEDWDAHIDAALAARKGEA